MRTQSKLFATAILLLAIVPACKFNCTIGGPSPSSIADAIKGMKTFESLGMTSVTCPESADLKSGGKFECTAEGAGKHYRFSVEMTNDMGEFAATRIE